MKKRFFGILMIMIMLFALSACSALNGDFDDTSAALSLFPSDIEERTFEDIEYVHFDMDYFRSYAQEVERMMESEKPDIDAIGDCIYEVGNVCIELMDMKIIAELHRDFDVTDDYWSGEIEYIDGITDEVFQTTGELMTKALELGDAKKIAKLAGYSSVDSMKSYAEYYLDSDTDLEESRLINEYYKKLYDCESDPDDAQKKELTNILLKLVQNRNAQAKKYGYNNYVEMMYDGFSVPVKDIEKFEDMLKSVAKDYPEILSFDYNLIAEESDFKFYSPNEVKKCLSKYLPRMDKKLGAAFDRLDKRGMFILTEDDKANDFGYTSFLTIPNTPVVYNYSTRDFRGISDSFHEFGHAYAKMLTSEGNGEYGEWENDVALSEIQSSGLEALLFSKYDEIYGDNSEAAKLYMAEFFLYCIIGSAADDSFERELYTTPNLTPEKVCDLFVKSRSSYGCYYSDPYDFLYTSHYFDNPIYQAYYMFAYYATSQLILQAEKDFEGAVANYMKAAACGENGRTSYVELIDDMGISGVKDLKAAGNATSEFCEYVNMLYEEY